MVTQYFISNQRTNTKPEEKGDESNVSEIKSNASKIEEGRGKGSGASYKPWIQTREVSSCATCSNPKDWKTGRTATNIIQITYLVVSCMPNSNFATLYRQIGETIDNALGYPEPVYEIMITKKCRSLAEKQLKVCELIEKFSI